MYQQAKWKFQGMLLAGIIGSAFLAGQANGEQLFIEPVFEPELVASNQVYRSDAERIDGSTATLLYDVYQPNQISGGPAVPDLLPGMILIHGGGFRNGSKNNQNMIQTANYFASRGYVVSTINYRLIDEENPLLDPAVEAGPFAVFPPTDPADYVEWALDPINESLRISNAANAAHNDASAFANFIFAGNDWDFVDTSRVAIMGTSAGAITSLMVAYGDHPNGPVQDLGATVSLAGGLYGFEFLIDADDPALWFQHGFNDMVVEFSNALAIQLQAEQVGLTYSFHTHNQGHSTSGAYFSQVTDQGLIFSEDSVQFLYTQLQLIDLAGIILGDVNLDGTVNLLDVDPFVDLLTIGGYRKQADVNQDGSLNLLDVSVFVDILSQ